MTSGTDSQIKTAYEVNKMTPEQIAEELGFTVLSIKAKLMQCSSLYRKDCGQEDESRDELNFSKEEARRIKQELFDLAMTTEDEHLKGKLLLNLRDDSRGRKDVVKQVSNSPFNILQINQVLQQARSGADSVKRILSGQPAQQDIEVV